MNTIKEISKIELKNLIHEQLINCGFLCDETGYHIYGDIDKPKIRDVYLRNRHDQLEQYRSFVIRRGPSLINYFANGSDIIPSKIRPELVEVLSGTTESDIFKLATLLWSVPVSPGFGRRIRFLVIDRQNEKLIGIFAIGDPVFNLTARDKYIGWNSDDRKKRLIHVMDAFVVGAVPPYSQLIGGKLVAALTTSTEIQNAYNRKYLNKTSIISGEAKHANLALLTTTSALGRSSIYNRLVIPNGSQFLRVGKTRGFGHFHLSGELFELMRQYLEQIGHPYASGNRFGMGPNWRFRVIRVVLDQLGFDSNNVLRHGIEREVYLIPLVVNWKELLLGQQNEAKSLALPSSDISEFCLSRWIVPRASRDDSFKSFEKNFIMNCLLNGGPPSHW